MNMGAVNPFKEGAEAIIEAGGEALKSCYQCGLCSSTCPWNLVRDFLPREFIHRAQLGLVELEGEETWLCTTCGACVARCPREVEIIEIMRAIRRIGVEWRVVPEDLGAAMANIRASGNPWGEAPERRAAWAEGLDIKTFTEGTESLYFPCCTPAYDPRTRRVAVATATVLKEVGADFGILGPEERCCGESVRKAGNEKLFESLVAHNIATFTENGVTKIIVSSPHCYHTFKNEYPRLGGDFEVEVIHFSQFLAGLIDELSFTKELDKKVIYHDPCYLGRHNGIYDEPRRILQSIPGVELLEFPDSREEGLCCGGGGGRIWMETRKGERFSDLRLEQALEVGADVLAVFCPYCMLNFDDSLLSLEEENVLEVRDVAELVQEAI